MSCRYLCPHLLCIYALVSPVERARAGKGARARKAAHAREKEIVRVRERAHARESMRTRARTRKRESLCRKIDLHDSNADTATHCNTLQHTATHCNTMQHTATHCNTCAIVTPTAAPTAEPTSSMRPTDQGMSHITHLYDSRHSHVNTQPNLLAASSPLPGHESSHTFIGITSQGSTCV